MAKNTVNANFNQIAVTDASDNVWGIRAAVGNVQITGGTAGQVLTATATPGVISWATASSAVTGERVVADNGPPDSTWLKAGLTYTGASYPNLAPLYQSYTATNTATSAAFGWGAPPYIFYAAGRYIAIESGNGTVKRTKYSTDGITWTTGGNLPTTAGGSWSPKISWNGSVFFTVNSLAASRIGATSPDGVTWTQLTLPVVTGTNYWYGTAALGTTLVATEYTNTNTTSQVAVSTDNGATWTTGTIPFNSIDFVASSGTQLITAKYGTTDTAYSTNGTTWTLGSALPASLSWEGAAWNGKHWLMTHINPASTTAAMSYNGINWFTATLPLGIAIQRPLWNGKMWQYWNGAAAMLFSSNPQLPWSNFSVTGRTMGSSYYLSSDGTGNSFIMYDQAQDKVYTYSLTASSTFTIPAGPALSSAGEWFVKS